MSKEGKKKKGAAAAEDQGAPCDEKLWPVPEASSAAASRDVIDEVSVGESTHSDIHLVFSRSPPVECLNHDDIDAMDMQPLECTDATSLTPEQRQHAQRFLLRADATRVTLLPPLHLRFYNSSATLTP